MPVPQYTKITFYVVAHADDWQLFMQPNAYNDLVAQNCKVIFIVITAGDAGFAKTYWSAREEGLKSSVRLCLAPLSPIIESNSTREFNHHGINCWTANNTSCYFLRLPDGNLDGSGFLTYGNQSLSSLKEGKITAITSVDNSAAYNSWSDLCITLQTIIKYESGSTSDLCINYLNPDRDANPNDHRDHITSGEALQEMNVIFNLRQNLFVGYSVGNTTNTLLPEALFWKAGMFAAYEKAVYDICGYSTLQESISTYQKWCLSSAKSISIKPQNSYPATNSVDFTKRGYD